MDLIAKGVTAGVLGTLVMDGLNFLFARTGMLSKIEVGMIGRMAAGWTRGCFRYGHPSEMGQAVNEMLYGYDTHHTIGVLLVVPYLLGWDLLVGGPASPGWAFGYGVATTAASYFFVFPSMGLGVFGWRSPEGIRAPLSALANHLFYGMGLAVGVALVWAPGKAEYTGLFVRELTMHKPAKAACDNSGRHQIYINRLCRFCKWYV